MKQSRSKKVMLRFLVFLVLFLKKIWQLVLLEKRALSFFHSMLGILFSIFDQGFDLQCDRAKMCSHFFLTLKTFCLNSIQIIDSRKHLLRHLSANKIYLIRNKEAIDLKPLN